MLIELTSDWATIMEGLRRKINFKNCARFSSNGSAAIINLTFICDGFVNLQKKDSISQSWIILLNKMDFLPRKWLHQCTFLLDHHSPSWSQSNFHRLKYKFHKILIFSNCYVTSKNKVTYMEWKFLIEIFRDTPRRSLSTFRRLSVNPSAKSL
jgi:hypothetical protein